MNIAQKTTKFLTIAVIALFTTVNFALNSNENNQGEEDGGKVNTKSEITAYIQHHLADSHDFSLFSYTSSEGERKHFGFPLPVIVWTSKGLVTFMSSAFHHNDDGHVIVEKGGLKFAKIHSKIYELDSNAATVSFDESHHATNAHKVLDFSITKSVFGILLASLLIFLGFTKLAKQYKTKAIPTGLGRALEPLVLYVRDEIARPNIGEKKYRKFMPYLLTVFFFIWILNLMGLTPFGFNVTGQIAITVCLALFTLVVYISNGTKDFWMHTLWMPGVPKLLRPILAVLELAGFLLIKPFSLLVRLFANITAGHSVVMGIAALMILLKTQFGTVGATGISFALTLFLTVIEILVAFLQAFIFTMLSALFIGMAVEEHEHH
ncbi:F0F1 ATP synthase subunit A [uncultured Polaribacter sp.]|uniref:F0F1 ATP synthase subunit A n=1 Tax=uncultured Polaribacter sp. TaxID=174711 RepID=UPI00261CBAEA|nr:F0F1 ATP synthase subunit A [uncultured Polaribacter sp.]